MATFSTIERSQTATAQNRALLVRDSCKILRATSITNTLACRSIFNAQWRKTCRILQRSHTVKYDLAAKPRLYCIVRAQFRFKFIRCYVANLLNLYAQRHKFRLKFFAAEYFVSTRSQNIPQMQLHYETRPTKHRAPNGFLSHGLLHNDFWRAARALALQISRCERRPQYSAHLLSKYEIFLPMYSRGKPNLQQLLLLVQSQDVSYRRGAI